MNRTINAKYARMLWLGDSDEILPQWVREHSLQYRRDDTHNITLSAPTKRGCPTTIAVRNARQTQQSAFWALAGGFYEPNDSGDLVIDVHFNSDVSRVVVQAIFDGIKQIKPGVSGHLCINHIVEHVVDTRLEAFERVGALLATIIQAPHQDMSDEQLQMLVDAQLDQTPRSLS